ncbi:MAG: alpha-galactosidase [Clostridia bacterium]|nr:alpha-galactosidase [Clostridia bacterium]
MSIFFEKESKTFYLESKDTTYAFYINQFGFPQHLYFGKRIAREAMQPSPKWAGSSMIACIPGSGGFSFGTTRAEVSFYGNGDYREPMLQICDKNGDRLMQLSYERHDILKEKPALCGMPSLREGETLVLHLKDLHRNLTVDLYYTVYETVSAIARRAVITSGEKDALFVERAYSFSLDLPKNDYELLTLHGAWARECQAERTPMHHGIFSIGSKRGSSSASNNPFMAIVDKNTTEHAGEAYGVNLIYSGSYTLKAEVCADGTSRILGGINDFDFAWKLKEGEQFSTPEVVLAYSDSGLSKLSRQFHDLYREQLIPKKDVYASRPIVFNNWEGTYFNFNNERLMSIVDAIKGRGITHFVLDDGWFGARNNDKKGLGDWVVNTEKLEGGLKTIIDYVHNAGMKFGLWFEPEMVNPDSDLYRAHPDWAIHCPGHTPMEARNQLMLDLTRKEVRDYIVEAVSSILRDHEIDYVKWDSNRHITENFSIGLPADRQKEFHHRYTLGLYEICERIIGAFPEVFFEGCSSGGARFDAGMLYYFPQIWTSDDSDAYMRTRIQHGTSMAYPLSSHSCHVSICPNHQSGRTVPMQTRADIAHLGPTGYELDTAKLTEEELLEIPKQIEQFRKMEDLVMKGDLYRLENTMEGNYFAQMLVSKEKDKAVLVAMRATLLVNDEIHRFFPKGLEEDALYEIPELEITLSGRTAMYAGLILPFKTPGDYATACVHFNRI